MQGKKRVLAGFITGIVVAKHRGERGYVF